MPLLYKCNSLFVKYILFFTLWLLKATFFDERLCFEAMITIPSEHVKGFKNLLKVNNM